MDLGAAQVSTLRLTCGAGGGKQMDHNTPEGSGVYLSAPYYNHQLQARPSHPLRKVKPPSLNTATYVHIPWLQNGLSPTPLRQGLDLRQKYPWF